MKHLLPIALAAALLSGCAGSAFDKRAISSVDSEEFDSFCQDREAITKRYGVVKDIADDVVDTFVPGAVVGMANGDANSGIDTSADALNERCAVSLGCLDIEDCYWLLMDGADLELDESHTAPRE